MCTDQFEPLALALGADAERLITVPHPIADLPGGAIVERARAAADSLRQRGAPA